MNTNSYDEKSYYNERFSQITNSPYEKLFSEQRAQERASQIAKQDFQKRAILTKENN